jgi:hypothetical protein
MTYFAFARIVSRHNPRSVDALLFSFPFPFFFVLCVFLSRILSFGVSVFSSSRFSLFFSHLNRFSHILTQFTISKDNLVSSFPLTCSLFCSHFISRFLILVCALPHSHIYSHFNLLIFISRFLILVCALPHSHIYFSF